MFKLFSCIELVQCICLSWTMQARQSALTYCYATLFPGLSKQLNIAKNLKKALKEGRSK